jgi:glutamyl-tRNA reductase
MQEIILIGLNHNTAPVEIRECLAFSEEETRAALCELRARTDIEELILFSTCNRVELLLTTRQAESAATAARKFLANYKRVPLERFADALYQYQSDAAVRHMFRVAAGLDSLVMGEPQILGQVKEAYRTATEEKTSGVILNRLLHRTFFVAKRIRTETGIGDHAVSISYAAVELGRKIFGSLEGKKVLLLGAGEMAELAVEHLIRNRAGHLFVANRTFERGVSLAARYRGTAIHFDEVGDYMNQADIIIGSTGSPTHIVDRDMVKSRMRGRRNRPLFFIDIAVPRNIDPAVNELNNVYLYDIDDLKGVIDSNKADRRREAVRAERMIEEAVIQFRLWQEGLEVVPTIKALRTKIEAVAQSELQRTLGHMAHLSAEDRQAMEKMVHATINKILHDPTQYLKNNGCQGDRSQSLDFARKLFRLDE